MVVSNRTASKLLQVEQARDALANKQSAKANITATLMNPAKHTYRLRVENRGSGAARNVSVYIDGTPLTEHRVFSDSIPEKKEFSPGSSVEYRIALSLDVPPVRIVRTEWADDSGESGHNEAAFSSR
jgi:hypothetical protein